MHVRVHALALGAVVPSRADPPMEVKNIALRPGQGGGVVAGGPASQQLYFCLGFLMWKRGVVVTSQLEGPNQRSLPAALAWNQNRMNPCSHDCVLTVVQELMVDEAPGFTEG